MKRPSVIQRPRIGLALSGGAARGMAHVGVIRVLLEENIPIDFIAGTSAGALVGGAFASGMPVSEVEEITCHLRWRDMGRVTLSRLGVQSNERMEEYLRARLPRNRFEELSIPFAAVATDLQSGLGVVMHGEGDVAFAIRASCCIPGWYIPVIDPSGRQLVDGGLVANIPTAAVRSLGAELVIAVDVNSEGAKFLGSPQSAFGIMLQSMTLVQRTASEHQLQEADVVIRPRVGHIRWDEITRGPELMEAGAEAARKTIDRIKHLIKVMSAPSSRWYQFRGRRIRHKNEERRRLSPLR